MILVLDLGTSYFKFALVDHGGELVSLCRVVPPVHSSQPGRMELSPQAFLDALAQGVAELEVQTPGATARCRPVTFATQTNSFILLDAACRPLTPLILWPDVRAVDLVEQLHRLDRLPAFTGTTGVPALGREFMAAKLLWVQRESPEIWKSVAKICLISDYLTLLLTGLHVTEAGAAALTGLFDIHVCRWWPEALAQLDVPLTALPAVARAGTDLGPASSAETRGLRLGLPPSCRFVVGCPDQYAGAIGSGNVVAGSVSETTGTVLATVRCADRFEPAPPPGVFQGPAFSAGLYYQMAFGEVAANYLEWYRKQLPDRPAFQRLAELAGQVGSDAGGLRLNTNASLAGGSGLQDVFVGLGPSHTPGHVVRCIMETVARVLREQVAALSDGRLPAEIRSAGGGARSDLWLHIKADALGIPFRATHCPEPTCLGAAILAESALSGRDVRAIAHEWVRPRPAVLPRSMAEELAGKSRPARDF